MKEKTIIVFAIVLSGVFGGWLGLMALDNEPPWHYMDAAHGSYISPNPADQGQMIRTNWVLSDIKKECPRQVERSFTDRDTGKVVTTLDATPISRMKLDNNRLSRAFQLPPNMPPHVGYRATACFQCNVLQIIWPLCITSPELPFDVNP